MQSFQHSSTAKPYSCDRCWLLRVLVLATILLPLWTFAISFNNLISRNSIDANTRLVINWLHSTEVANLVTANDPKESDAGPNGSQNYPLITNAISSGGNTFLDGTLNSTPSRNFPLEFFSSPIADPSGSDEGAVYLGSTDVTTDASANANYTTTLIGVPVTVGHVASATANDLSNNSTSEFSAALMVASDLTIAGNVFEDVNYGGGAGRDRATALANGGSLRPNARVELFDGSGNYVTATTTNASGAYSFMALTTGDYTVRVVNSSVTSSRPGYSTNLRAVQTFKTIGSTGIAVAATNYVGGEVPNKVDAGNGSTTLAALETASFAAQSVSPITLSANISNIDFGFSFDVIANTNDAGQGSLRQFILNSNALNGDASLQQAGQIIAKENTIFMISNGTAAAGLRAANNYFTGGIATIMPATALPECISTVVLNASNQPGFTTTPIIEINGTNTTLANGIIVWHGPRSVIRGFIVNNFYYSGIGFGFNSDSVLVAGNWVGLTSDGNSAAPNINDGVAFENSINVTIGGTDPLDRNVLSGNLGDGIQLTGADVTGCRIIGNYIGTNATGTAAVGNYYWGVYFYVGSNNNTVGGNSTLNEGNLISGNGAGVVSNSTSSNNIIIGNRIGTNAAGTAALPNKGPGISFNSSNNRIGGTGTGESNLISGNTGPGIWLDENSNNNTILNNFIGTNAEGSAAIPNTGDGITIRNSSTGNIIGNGTTVGRNVISGNTGAGVNIDSGSHGATIKGNYIGVSAAGTALGNSASGITVYNSSNHIIGGSSAGEGNVISANGGVGLQLANSPCTNNMVRGNYIGVLPDGTTAAGNILDGVRIIGGPVNNWIGGINAGEGNIIANNVTRGIRADNGNTNRFIRNSIYNNGDLGIDLNADGVTLNDVGDPDGGANLRQNYPVITSISESGGNTTISGTLNSTAAAVTYRLDFYSNPTADPSNHGEGTTWLGTYDVTTNAAGNVSFSAVLTGVSVSVGHVVSATATSTSAGTLINTSEFSASLVFAYTLSGVVFEDVNYGGGAGRDRITALANGGSGRSGARVELFDASGNYLTNTTTTAGGNYTFPGLAPGTYTVRVVNSSVSSARTGYLALLRSVQTFRTDATSGTALPVTNYVGGEVPNKADAGNGATTLAALSTGNNTAQSISAVTLNANISNVDFGFSFDVVCNTNDSGQGSLRQMITNANILAGDATLAQQGLVAGKENGVFMISNGSSAPGLRAANNYFVGGRATISPQFNTAGVTATIVLNATLQPGFSGTPIIEMDGTNAGTESGLLLYGANGSIVRGFVINRFAKHGIGLALGSSNCVIAGNYLGTDHTGTLDRGNSLNGVALESGATNNTIGGTAALDRNVISGNDNSGVSVANATAAGNVIIGNYIGTNVAGTAPLPNFYYGVNIFSNSQTTTIGGTGAGMSNVISGNRLHGIAISNGSSTTIVGNFIGTDPTGTAALPNGGQGIEINSANNTIGGTTAAHRNIISGNVGAGIRLGTSNANTNSILGNYIGTDVTGSNDLGNTGSGIEVSGGNGNLIGGSLPGQGNTLSGNTEYGIQLSNVTNCIIRGNIIGLNATGTAALGNDRDGIKLTNGSGHIIGGNTAGARNIISGQMNPIVNADGIYISNSTNNTIQGNFIGTDITGTLPFPNYHSGIAINGNDNQIGGTGADEGNLIAFNNQFGISVVSSRTNNRIQRNSIHSNVGRGIDLNEDGITLNDLNDADSGGNDLLNFPVLNYATLLNGNLTVQGYARPGSIIECFMRDNDTTGFGEGRTYLFTVTEGSGSDANATTGTYGPAAINGIAQGNDSTNRFSFTVPTPPSVINGTELTATATIGSNTSEFSARVIVTDDLDLDDDGIPNSLEIGDTDLDGVPDAYDLDSDNDGIYDSVESGSGALHTNGVLNGAVNPNGIPVAADTDGDGTINYMLADSDADANYDFTELDSDEDGCFDVIEAGYVDHNADGLLGNTPLTTNPVNGLVTSTAF